mmetsp:Transcript_2994/g.9099  ORF Transcript_2994/g.9099 Transcript_2994/m.9099 type:complete len:300 (+) Transcript_2994:743-1642(+)
MVALAARLAAVGGHEACVSLALAAARPREAVLVRVVAALALLARQQLLERGERAGGAAGRVDAVARVVRAERVVEVLHLPHAEPVAVADVFLLEGRHRKEEALAAGWVEVDVAELVELVAARLFTTAARVKTVFSAGRVERVAARVFALQLPVKSVVQDEGAGRHANHADVPHHLGRDLVVRHARLGGSKDISVHLDHPHELAPPPVPDLAALRGRRRQLVEALWLLAGEDTDPLGVLEPERGDPAQVIEVEEVHASAARHHLLVGDVEEVGEALRGADEVVVGRRDDGAAPRANLGGN